jgi:dolichol-phosphate mannosyltransferase
MLWILLPAYNEEDSLPRLLPKIAQVFGEQNLVYHIVVVDDGSQDDTARLLKEYADQMPLDVVTHNINRGLGETERDGFEYIASHCQPEDTIVRMDCDDTHEPEYAFAMLEKLLKGYEVVSASRFEPGGGQVGVDGFRAFISYSANVFMKIVFNIPGLKDYSCGYRAYRGQVIQDAVQVFGNNFIQLRGLGFTSTLETIVKLHILGCRFAEVPFTLRYDQKASPSKMIGNITTLGYLIMGLLYHWPFSGWRNQFRQLGELYRKDRQQALETYNYRQRRRGIVGRLSF